MQKFNELPAEIAGSLPMNPLLVAKTGQLSLMNTLQVSQETVESTEIVPASEELFAE